MPEEKVSKRNNPDVSEWGSSGYIPVLPKPAADAGPRQHCYCGHPLLPCGCPCDCHCGFCEHCRTHKAAAPPVPQEAAPRPDCEMWSSPESVLAFDDELNGEDDTEHGQSSEELGHSFAAHFKPAPPEATAPDSAMRVAEQKAFTVTWNSLSAKYTVSIPCYDGGKVVRLEDVAALIRQAESERERALTDLLTRLVAKLKIILPKVDGIIGLQSMRAGHDIYNGPNLKDELAEASRLLGGESK